MRCRRRDMRNKYSSRKSKGSALLEKPKNRWSIVMWHDAWRPKSWKQRRRPLLGNGSVNTFARRQNDGTTPLLGRQILGKQLIDGRRKHIPVETVSIREWTVFSLGPPWDYITGRIEGVFWVGSRSWSRRDGNKGRLHNVLQWQWDCYKSVARIRLMQLRGVS
jgi:hypothetical protein